jgi:hypothetical protein
VNWPASSASLEGGVDAALAQAPAVAGVGQILAEGERSLTIGRPADLRKWFGSQLGRAKVKKGQRPPTDLTAVARTLRWTVATSQFHQRLLFERVMARHVPVSARRDLKTPAYLRLDPAERFPRVTIHMGGGGRSDLFGPFRNRAAADKARDALHKLFPLRPCDYTFEPHAELPLGLSCLYAQVKSCAAPCLVRVSEDDYRGLAREAAGLLSRPSARGETPPAWLPEFVHAASARAVVAERGAAGIEVYPVVAGVVDETSMVVAGEQVAAAITSLRWASPAAAGGDEAWLMSWLFERRRRGVYSVLEADVAGAAAAIAACMAAS